MAVGLAPVMESVSDAAAVEISGFMLSAVGDCAMANIGLIDENELPTEYQGEDLLVTLSSAEDLPSEYQHLLGDPSRTVYRALAHRPAILDSFRALGRTAWASCGLTARQREIAILTTGRALNARYEWHQHVRVGLMNGLTPAEIRAIADKDDTRFDPSEQAVIAFVRAFVHRRVNDEILGAFIDEFDEATAVGVTVLVGIYLFIAHFEDAFGLTTEEPFVGWDLDGLGQ